MENETTERTFTVSGPTRLNVKNISGSVDIQPGDDGVVSVTAVKHAGSGDAERTQVEIAQAADGTVTVETSFPVNVWHVFGQRPCDVDYTVRVPRQCSAHVHCVSSGASVRGLAGEFALHVVSGNLALANLSGPLKLNSVSGDVSGESLAGPATLDVVSGDVRLVECEFPSMHGSTVSGAVQIESPLGSGPYHFHSVSGDITLIVPPNARGTIEGSSVSGRLRTALAATRNQSSNRHWRVELQGGGPEMRFNSISGNLVIQTGGKHRDSQATISPQAEPVHAVPPSPATPQGDPQDTAKEAPSHAEILDRVSRGELSVEDALKALGEEKQEYPETE